MFRVRTFILMASGAVVTSCAGYFPPKPLPEWAISQQIHRENLARKPTRRVAAAPEELQHPNARLGVASADPTTTGSIGSTLSQEDADQIPFTKEWYARQQAIDARLRARTKICTRC